MNATLEKELSALSVEEKAEVIDLLLPAVVGSDDDIPPRLLAELERRADEFEKHPVSYSIEEVEIRRNCTPVSANRIAPSDH